MELSVASLDPLKSLTARLALFVRKSGYDDSATNVVVNKVPLFLLNVVVNSH